MPIVPRSTGFAPSMFCCAETKRRLYHHRAQRRVPQAFTPIMLRPMSMCLGKRPLTGRRSVDPAAPGWRIRMHRYSRWICRVDDDRSMEDALCVPSLCSLLLQNMFIDLYYGAKHTKSVPFHWFTCSECLPINPSWGHCDTCASRNPHRSIRRRRLLLPSHLPFYQQQIQLKGQPRLPLVPT